MTDFPLFETICLENGKLQNMAFHQQRYEQSLATFYGKSAVKIYDLLAEIHKTPEFSTALLQPLVRCRIAYNADSLQIQFFPYERKTYCTFQPVICDDIDYGLKYQDRVLLNALLEQKQDCDEIMIIKQGKVTDCSIGNLIFRSGNVWVTPDEPLLNGTQRQFLLAQGKIKEQPIFAEDVVKFDEIRLINAMNGLFD